MKNPAAADIVAASLTHFDAVRYDLWAWCVMPNHVHVVVQPRSGFQLSKIIQGWKSFTSRQINLLLDRHGQLWQAEPFDHLVRSYDKLQKFIQYTYDNPDKAGLCNWKWRWRTP
jgi:REP element-mobilizing transposase RayT